MRKGKSSEAAKAEQPGNRADGLTVAAILVGATLRAAQFAGRGAFWGDEAALGYNLLARSYGQLARPLDLYQAAPIGFLMLEKLVGNVFGMEENVLRLPALVAGIVTLVLTAWLSRSLFGPGVAAIATLLLALSPDLIRYSAEFKPYTFDSAISIGLFALFVRRIEGGGRNNLAALAVAGTLAPWFSLPSVFVLAGLGGCLIVQSAVNGNRRLTLALGLMATLWVASFAVEYFLCLRAVSAEPELIQYWSGSFAPFPPRSVADLRWYGAKAIYLFEPVVGLRARHLALGVFLIGFGLIGKRKPLVGACLGLTVATVVAASAVGKYPFNGRLILFLMPILILPLATSIERLLLRSPWPRIALGLILLGGLIFQPAQLAATRIGNDFRAMENPNPDLAIDKTLFADYRPGDRLCREPRGSLELSLQLGPPRLFAVGTGLSRQGTSCPERLDQSTLDSRPVPNMAGLFAPGANRRK